MELTLKTAQKKTNPNEAIIKDLPCLPIYQHILEGEYQQERARSERLDTKAMALLTLILALITVYVPIFPLNSCKAVYNGQTTCAIAVLFSLFLLVGIAGIVLAIYSARVLCGIYEAKPYKGVNLDTLGTREKLGQNTDAQYQIDVINQYNAAISENAKINEEKATELNKQFKKIIIIFATLSISAAGMSICVGLC